MVSLKHVYNVKLHFVLTSLLAVFTTFFTDVVPPDIYEDFGIFGSMTYAFSYCSLPWILAGIIALIFKFAWFSALLAGFQVAWLLFFLKIVVA